MSVGLPVVNIGDRQRGRERTSCMLNVDYNRKAIGEAIEKALSDEEYRRRLAEFTRQRTALDTPAEVTDCLRTLDLGIVHKPKPFFEIPGPEGDENR